MSRAVSCVGKIIGGAVLMASFARADSAAPSSLAASGLNSRWLSDGLYSALASAGVFGAQPTQTRARAAGVSDLSKGKPPAVLDARVGPNVRLGDDPAALPATQRGQAEPHIVRSAASPDVLLATFQEGRFVDGGALDCGYALSRDGGLSWSRALIPQLTTSSAGIYQRATDPVAAIGPQGDLYLCTLASIDNAFGLGAIVVSRSFDNTNWTVPSVVFQSPNSQTMADKEWLAVNDFPGTPNSARLVVTWTNFTFAANGNVTGNNLLAAISDDRGATWSAPVAITPAGSLNQGTFPLFLPDGSLAIIYITFANANTSTVFSVQCKRSTDGGRTFPAAATTAVSLVNGYADPDLRSGVFLPSAAVARTTGEIVVTYVAVVSGTPRVMVVKSSDQGATWTAPVIASDNPIKSAVNNPAVAVTPDGRTVSVVFIDKRLTPTDSTGHNFFIDHFAAISFDGGATWQPNVRLSEMTSDIRFAAHTSEGYMLGDYLGLAPSFASDQPCVAIWCDTRTGDADPYVGRFTPAATADYQAWSIARFTRTELADLGKSAGRADFDTDGYPNYLEFTQATNPRVRESGESIFVQNQAATLDFAWLTRVGGEAGAAPLARNLATSAVIAVLVSPSLQIIPVTPPAGMVWSGRRVPGPSVAVQLNLRAAVPLGTTAFELFAGETTASRTDSRLINLSTRGQVGTGANQLIAGFVYEGNKSILIRAAGPALAALGVSGALADPQLTLENHAGIVARNDNWQQSGDVAAELFARLGAFPFANGSLDAALSLQTANAVGTTPPATQQYTATVAGVNNTSGVALAEVYDAEITPGAPANPRLLNVSSRGGVGSGTDALIAGFVIRGTQPRRVLLRAIGPSLTQFNVPGVIADPLLTLYDSGNQIVAANDDWEISRSGAAIAATAQNVGAFALNPASLDSALLITLNPGAYTAVVTGVNGATGVALVEVYDAN